MLPVQSIALAESSTRRNEWKHYAKVIDKFKSKSSSMSGQMAQWSVNLQMHWSKSASCSANPTDSSDTSKMSPSTTIILRMRTFSWKIELKEQWPVLTANLEKFKHNSLLANDASPIKVIDRKQDGKGQTWWPLYIWEVIIQQIINGTPPSAVNNNLIAHEKHSPCWLK